ncbi:hypothetical protein PVAG01_00320 [Phlyctema vagabunda]|uniref:DUF6594 domain-containing protein n=1 Tax=Phlyctema vagabunda TaxID=108571 RepID=A0ABR4PU10_9HELO
MDYARSPDITQPRRTVNTIETQFLSTSRLDFEKHWRRSTDDDNLTLHGFRRFKTSHLINLRFLEDEIARMDHLMFQAGLSLSTERTSYDRLGLRNARIDAKAQVMPVEEIITEKFVLELRGRIKEYDEALASFNQIMAMETFSLLDDEKQTQSRTDLSLHEKYKTRLIRVDRGPRRTQDPVQRRLHEIFRFLRYWHLSKTPADPETSSSSPSSRALPARYSYRNSMLLSEITGRFLVATATGLFLVVPLAILSRTQDAQVQILTVSLCIVVFAFLVSVTLRVSNLEMMMVSAAYAAVLSVFVSSNDS